MNRKNAAEKIKLLRSALEGMANAFAVTLMVLQEKMGEADVDKRYEHAERHPQIKLARLAMRDTG